MVGFSDDAGGKVAAEWFTETVTKVVQARTQAGMGSLVWNILPAKDSEEVEWLMENKVFRWDRAGH